MAPQDYISRSKNKKKSPYKKSKPEPTGIRLKTKLIALFTLVAIATFAYLLWAIKDNKPETQQPTKVTTKKADQKALPKPPQEKWRYMEELKNKEVEVGEYEVKKKGPYQMQCGSFRTKAQAETLKANIAFNGLESQIRRTTGKNGVYYRVILGPYERKRLAERDKHKLQNNNIIDCQIWLWR